jgi:hypothetical protein
MAKQKQRMAVTHKTDLALVGADRNKFVPIGGIRACWSARFIEGRSSGGRRSMGRSRTARAAVAIDWVIWKYNWPFHSGKHTFTVRCYEENGTPQIAAPSPAEPNGATGLHSKAMML